MTKFTVTWRAGAQAELARIWLAAHDRQQISAAANRIDVILGRDPSHQGDFVSDISRQLIVHPLRVLFVVRPDDCLVEIYKVAVVMQ